MSTAVFPEPEAAGFCFPYGGPMFSLRSKHFFIHTEVHGLPSCFNSSHPRLRASQDK